MSVSQKNTLFQINIWQKKARELFYVQSNFVGAKQAFFKKISATSVLLKIICFLKIGQFLKKFINVRDKFFILLEIKNSSLIIAKTKSRSTKNRIKTKKMKTKLLPKWNLKVVTSICGKRKNMLWRATSKE